MKTQTRTMLACSVIGVVVPTAPVAAQCFVASQVAELLANDGVDGDQFGKSFAVAGDTAVVGAWNSAGKTGHSGATYVFSRGPNGWTQQAKLMPSDGSDGDRFGCSVAIDGDTVVVGAELCDIGTYSNQGAAYVFTRSAGIWSEVAKLVASDGLYYAFFGSSVGISGDTVLVGARDDDNQVSGNGSAYVFKRSGSVWTQQQKLLPVGTGHFFFGSSVAISGDNAIVGDWEGNVNPGHAHVFSRTGAAWVHIRELTQPASGFGNRVAIAGETAVVGAAQGTSAFVFYGPDWNQPTELAANGPAVGISGDIITAGRQVFLRLGATWAPQDLLVGGGSLVSISEQIALTYSSGVVTVSALSNLGIPAIDAQPQPGFGCFGSSSGFSVTASGVGSFRYQWKKGTSALVNGANVAGATSPELSLLNLGESDAGSYSCIVTNDCGSATSDAATLVIGLDADLTGNNVVNTQDLTILLAFFGTVATPEHGDIDHNGVVNTLDLVALLGAFGRTCP